MAGIVSRKFRINVAEQFHEAFSEASPTIMYMFIARNMPWPDDANPPTPTDTLKSNNYDVWKNMIAVKRSTSADVSFGSARTNWITSTLYEQYEDDTFTMWANNYFVVTDSFNIYKCLFNNSGVVSTVKPTGTANTRFTTADGYIWKYMSTISAGDALKFLTTNFMPIKTLSSDDGTPQWDVQTGAANGGIEVVDITAGGSLYGDTDAGTFDSVTNSTIVILRVGASSTDGLYVGSDVYTVAGTGSGQLRRIIGYAGATRTATMNVAFTVTPTDSTTYQIAPSVVLVGDGSGFEAYSTVSANAISLVTVTDTGSNYANVSVSFNANNGTGAVGAVYLPPYGGHGSDAVEELVAHNVMINVQVDGSESNIITVANDYRVIGLLADPVYDSDNTFANSTVYDQTLILNTQTHSGQFTIDEKVTGSLSGATGIVIDFTSNTKLRLVETSGTFSNAEVITGNTSAVTANTVTVTNPALRKFSGEILYVDNRSPINRSEDQTEDVKFIVSF